jgi:hypothetical protein
MENLDISRKIRLTLDFENTIGGVVQLCSALGLPIEGKNEAEILEIFQADLFPKLVNVAFGPLQNAVTHQFIQRAAQVTAAMKTNIENSLNLSVNIVNPE